MKPFCAECGKELERFKSNSIRDYIGNRFCSLEHKEKYNQVIKIGKRTVDSKDGKGANQEILKEIKDIMKENQPKSWEDLGLNQKIGVIIGLIFLLFMGLSYIFVHYRVYSAFFGWN